MTVKRYGGMDIGFYPDVKDPRYYGTSSIPGSGEVVIYGKGEYRSRAGPNDYEIKIDNLDDDLLWEAISRVGLPDEWRLVANDCGTWAKRVLEEYYSLELLSEFQIAVSAASDPNQKTGITGFGTNGFVLPGSLLAYRIDFENETNASAPAQQVVITDQLSTNLDWAAFELTELGFGDQFIAVPPNSQHFETNVPVSYLGTNFEVQIEAGLQLYSGLFYANFRSIDPATGLPPPVEIGFLPPNVRTNGPGAGQGQGHVSYTINARTNLFTGTQLTNVAWISFDLQPPYATDLIDPHDPNSGHDAAKQCPNTIDAGAPASAVLPLPATNQSAQFTVSWSGTDDVGGSGVASYDVYVSDNGGPWLLWLSSATNTTATYTGQPSHTYGFYSVACDYVGNQETPPAVADATTTVTAMLLLSTARTNNQVLISWPQSAQGFQLESCDSLAPPLNWETVTNTPVIVGDQYTVTLDVVGESKFYRLRNP